MYIILGKTGYIAEAIIKELELRKLSFLALSRSETNYTNYFELNNFLCSRGMDPRQIKLINCAGYVGKPNVDACERAKADCIEGNVLLPTMLAQLCQNKCYKLIHISSGCIYGGYEKAFSEEDPPNFDFQNGSFYSGTKALAEKMVRQNNPDSYIFRLRIPFDEHECPRNYLTKLLSYDRLLDAENSLTNRSDFAKYCIDLSETKAPYGIYNITNKGSVTTRHVVELIKRHLRDNLKFKMPNKEFNFFEDLATFSEEIIAPRSNCVLDTAKLEKYVKIRPVEDALSDSLSKYAIAETSQS
jgi:UDP-glucose 4,6-dehydratase